jgi:hypothetical protein
VLIRTSITSGSGWDNGRMPPTITLPCDVHPVADGVLVIPAVLPIHIPHDALGLTVREWLGVTPA